MARKNFRHKRIADSLLAFLGTELIKLNDERMKLVNLTAVEISRDLSYAKVYWSMLKTHSSFESKDKLSNDPLPTEEEIKAMTKLISEKKFHLKSEIAKNMDLRVVPELRFFYDTSAAYAYKVDSILDSLKESGDL